jgi:hypothetical protein
LIKAAETGAGEPIFLIRVDLINKRGIPEEFI